ncbi:M16 family metallopeptidase [Candidatus Anaplasma sp. TIGMIC]|uniref:M16 family metallopeptidase n=1 Tax=Candidatus Anaplasma sp. TIGMIC TaxID=3020713 RepID=UPI00232FC208|nr:pitrilysin family protein [Candidatus Anaplasma sp. TIGMIC]MDB1135326.1 pitrilysin family protein [Candidatus Anaplasma sp. TIGMIC]
MKVFFSAYFLFFVLLAGIADAGELQKLHSTKLKNGMQVYVMQDKRLPVVMHMLIYKVGGMDDPPGLSGIAHFFEHLMFSGTKKFPDFVDTVSKLGGELNAATSTPYTAYYELINKRHLPLVMEMEADRMHSLLLTDRHIERERNVVREERNMRVESSIKGLIFEEVYNIFYRNGYGTPVIGWEHEMANYGRDSVDAFYHKYYNPNNAILLVVGDVNFNDVVKLAKSYYGSIENRHSAPERTFLTKAEPPHRSDVIVRMQHPDIADPVVAMLYKAPSIVTTTDPKKRAAMGIASEIVAGSEFGVLHHELVSKRSIATRVDTSYSDREKSSGIVAIEMMPKSGITPEDISKEAKQIIAELVESGVTEELVESAKYRNAASFIYSLDGMDSRAWVYAGMLAAGVQPTPPEQMIEIIKSLSVDDINDALRETFVGATVEAHLTHKDVHTANAGAQEHGDENASVNASMEG